MELDILGSVTESAPRTSIPVLIVRPERAW
jgi:hypothetical protein